MIKDTACTGAALRHLTETGLGSTIRHLKAVLAGLAVPFWDTGGP